MNKPYYPKLAYAILIFCPGPTAWTLTAVIIHLAWMIELENGKVLWVLASLGGSGNKRLDGSPRSRWERRLRVHLGTSRAPLLQRPVSKGLSTKGAAQSHCKKSQINFATPHHGGELNCCTLRSLFEPGKIRLREQLVRICIRSR